MTLTWSYTELNPVLRGKEPMFNGFHKSLGERRSHKQWNCCVSGRCLSSSILKTRGRIVSEAESVSVFRWREGDTYFVRANLNHWIWSSGEETPTLLGLLERANLNHWIWSSGETGDTLLGSLERANLNHSIWSSGETGDTYSVGSLRKS
jgi:hypothetical protein